MFFLTISNANIANICGACNSKMVFGSNDLGGEFSQSDSLLTHALVGIPGITGTPWTTRISKNTLIECS